MKTCFTSLPVVPVSSVYHAGDIDPGAAARWSLEGPCLSASRCPHAWQSIARLGGRVLRRMDYEGALFMDGHELGRTMRDELVAWAVERGWAHHGELYRAWTFDAEEEQWRYIECASAGEAQAEVSEVEGPNGPSVERVQGVLATAKLDDWMRRPHGTGGDVTLDLVYPFTLALSQNMPELVGVSWRDDFAPDRLSAPRIAILPGAISRFTVTSVAWEEVEDDPDLPAPVVMTLSTPPPSGPGPAPPCGAMPSLAML